MRRRRHRLRRGLTRTPVLLAAFVLVVVVAAVLDTSHQPPGCHFVTTWLETGASYSTRVCSHDGPDAGTPSALGRLAFSVTLLLGTLAAVLLVLLAVKAWRELELRRARRR